MCIRIEHLRTTMGIRCQHISYLVEAKIQGTCAGHFMPTNSLRIIC